MHKSGINRDERLWFGAHTTQRERFRQGLGACLKGISTGEMQTALEVLVGPDAKGLSASTVARLKHTWREEHETWRQRRIDEEQWVYIWVDGIYSGLRADQHRLCALVVIGVTAQGEKHLLAIEDGVRESTQSWREVLLSLKARGMNPPTVAVGDGALGFWGALEELYPSTKQQRCWVHKTRNVLNAVPKSVQPKGETGVAPNLAGGDPSRCPAGL